MGKGKTEAERLAWLMANLRPATPEEIIAQKREAREQR
jgi:hypothetical protein